MLLADASQSVVKGWMWQVAGAAMTVNRCGPKVRDRSGRYSQSQGFTLFEMVVTICAIVILYMVAEQRLNELPAAAERANFYGVLEQIKTGVNFEMVTRLAAGRSGEISQLEGRNPMEFLIEPPSNYRGELAEVTDAVERRGSWYFETSTQNLVYVVGGASIEDVLVRVAGQWVNLGQIRLKLVNHYTETARASGNNSIADPAQQAAEASRNWEGLVLREVADYEWTRRQEQPVQLN